MVRSNALSKIRLGPFVIRTMPLTDINLAFDLMHEGKSIRSPSPPSCSSPVFEPVGFTPDVDCFAARSECSIDIS